MQQAQLIAALMDWPAGAARENVMQMVEGGPSHSGARGLQVYQANAHALAGRALLSTYPVVGEILGPESFSDLARALWHSHPPLRGDVGQWGAALADFVELSEQLADVPYLSDVARVEWALHCCATVPDPVLDAASLQLLTTDDPATLTLTLASGYALVPSVWPVVSLVQTHKQTEPAFAQVAELLRLQVPETAVVWRQGLQCCVRVAQIGELTLLSALQNGFSLTQALDEATDLEFASWFPMAISSDLVTGVRLLKT